MRATLNWLPAVCLLMAGCSTGGHEAPSTTAAPGPAPGYASTTTDAVQRVVCQWHTEQTPDGRTIQVATYYLVDDQGRVVRRLKDDEVK